MSSREVTFDSGGCVIAGTYAEATNPVAAALLITGSGKTDRDSDVHLPLHQMLRGGITRQISDALVAAGVSTLRFDKRGVGASDGDYLTAGMDQRMTDAAAALGWLAAESAGLPVLAVGHSEGTYYAARLAAHGQLAGAVLLSGSVRRGEDVLAWQTAQMATRLPRVATIIFRVLRIDPVKLARKNLERILASSDDVMRIQGTRINARWIRDFATYDPAPALTRITVPVLAITGGQDVQVPPEDVEASGRLVRGPFDGLVVGDLSHLLRPDPGSIGPRGYKRAVREPVSREVLELITNWVGGHWGAHDQPQTEAAGENR